MSVNPAQKLAAARELIRSAGIAHEGDLLAMLNSVLSSCAFKDGFTAQLADLCCDLDSAVSYPPELSSLPRTYSEPAQFDAFTERRRA